MSGLVEKLEAAEVGSRSLDALIWLRLNRPEYQGGVKALEMRTWHDGRGHLILETDAGEEVADDIGIAPVTTSLDAALALAERVLPGDPDFQPTGPSVGWKINLYRGMVPAPLGGWIATVRRHASDGFDGSAPTPALALCIAICRALNLNETRHAE